MPLAPLPRGVIELDRTPLFSNAQQLLARAEAEIRLIDRAQPRNAAAEREALIEEWGAGKPRAPRFEYAKLAPFGPLRASLVETATALDGSGALGKAYAARALELELEARAAEHVGTADFAPLCARRFGISDASDEDTATAWARRFLTADVVRAERLIRSDDRRDPSSLVCSLERATVGLPVHVEVRKNQVSAAAVGHGFIGVRPSVWHSEDETRRIVLHEIEGHVRPRVLAQRAELGLFRVGSALSNDDEEGRALLLERGAGLLEGERKRELARRHLAARALRAGASFNDIVELLRAQGQSIASSVEAACRVARGGGLGREIIYLGALARVTRGFAAEPELERYLEHGRVSVDAARACRAGFA